MATTAGTERGGGAGQAVIAAGMAAAVEALDIEARSIARLADRAGGVLVQRLEEAVSLVSSSTGRLVVSGIGKSGLVGRKFAATLASTGTPSLFVHATEALHGDAGMVVDGDVVVLISNSGETAEVCQFGLLLRDRGVAVIAMTGDADSTLGGLASVTLPVAVEREADPLNLAPTASTTATMAVGDALAAALMVINDFGPADFARHHPGGSLGTRLAASTGDA